MSICVNSGWRSALQVFVAEALRDLVVAVVAGHHQQLLEQLRRLRQREEAAVVDAARHEVVARAFRRGLAEHRRLDVDEAVRVEELAHLHRDAVAQHQVLLHRGPAQIEHAVREARGLRQVVVVHLERRRQRRVQHRQSMAQHLDPAAFQLLVDGAFGPRAHQAFDPDAELVAHVFGRGEHLGAIRVADDLHVAFAVAQVDEDHAAVVAPAVHPAAQGHGLAEQSFGHQTAVMGTHGRHCFWLFRFRRSGLRRRRWVRVRVRSPAGSTDGPHGSRAARRRPSRPRI